jgi:hypothetical protein
MLHTQSRPNAIFSPTNLNTDTSGWNREHPVPHIMILDGGRLLDDAICALLWEELDMHVSVIHLDDEELIAQAIVLQNPDVVILCKSAIFSVGKLCQILEDRKYGDPIHIMSISICGNSLEIYDQKQLVSTNFRNFVNLIKEINFTPRSF